VALEKNTKTLKKNLNL